MAKPPAVDRTAGSATASPGLLAVDSAGESNAKRGRGRPKGSGKSAAVPAKGAEKLTALVAFVFQWVTEMLAGILDMPELALDEVQTDENETISEADVLAVYPTRYLLKTALGKQAAKIAADDDLVKTLVILANYSLRVTPAIVRKWSDVSTTRPAREIGGPTTQADPGNAGPAVAGVVPGNEPVQRPGGGLRWGGLIPGNARTDSYGPGANGTADSIPVTRFRGS